MYLRLNRTIPCYSSFLVEYSQCLPWSKNRLKWDSLLFKSSLHPAPCPKQRKHRQPKHLPPLPSILLDQINCFKLAFGSSYQSSTIPIFASSGYSPSQYLSSHEILGHPSLQCLQLLWDSHSNNPPFHYFFCLFTRTSSSFLSVFARSL